MIALALFAVLRQSVSVEISMGSTVTLQEPSRLILVHGWCGSAEAWAPIVNLLADYEDLSAMALRLSGSPGAHSGGPYTVHAAADRLVNELTAGPGPATLIGHSMGAQITLLAHLRAPDLVTSEIVIDPAYGAEDDESLSMNEWAARIEAFGHSEIRQFFAEAFTPALPALARERIVTDLLATDPRVIAAYLRSEYVDHDAIGLKSAARPAAAERTRPVLALHSSERGAEFESTLASPFGSQVEQWPGHGHYLHLEDPARFVHRLTEWLENNPSRTSGDKDGLATEVTG